MSDIEQDPRMPESGVTLIELLVTVLLLGVVMSLIGTLLVTTLRTGGTVQSATAASRSVQVISDSIETGIRNSSEFRVTTSSAGDQLLVARVATAAGDAVGWGCSAWYYAAATDTLRSAQLPAPYTLPTTEPTAWTVLGSGVTPGTGDTVFPASSTSGALDFTFRYGAGRAAPVTIEGSAVSRMRAPLPTPPAGSGPTRCY